MGGEQGLHQTGGSTAKPYLEQNQLNSKKQASKTVAEIGSRIGPGADTLGGKQGLHQSGGITAKPYLE